MSQTVCLTRCCKYPRTEVYLTALLGLAERSEDASQQWHYYQRVIDAFTVSDAPILSWYWLAYQKMLELAEQDRSFASDNELDELIDGMLESTSVLLPGDTTVVRLGLYRSR